MDELIKGSPHKRICSFAVLAKKDPLKTALKSLWHRLCYV